MSKVLFYSVYFPTDIPGGYSNRVPLLLWEQVYADVLSWVDESMAVPPGASTCPSVFSVFSVARVDFLMSCIDLLMSRSISEWSVGLIILPTGGGGGLGELFGFPKINQLQTRLG